MDASFVSHEDSNLIIEVSDDGLTWAQFTTIPLMKDFQYHYSTKITKEHIRFKNTVKSKALLHLKEV